MKEAATVRYGFLRAGALFAVIGIAFVPAIRSLAVTGGQSPGASLFIDPPGGAVTVGDTFTVTVYLDTGGQSVNAVAASIDFPPDKLQVVQPTAGKSIVRIWIAQPTYDNLHGTLRFEGAIPNPGVNSDRGIVSQVTFRAVSPGTAALRFSGDFKALLNDGKGTDILGRTTNAFYRLALPPPAGPRVVSETHPDQEQWYMNRTVALSWATDYPVEGYSFMLSDSATDEPDDIPEGDRTEQNYPNLGDGIHYFHIKSLRNGVWGGVTHYAVRIDAAPPADFPVDITPSSWTTTQRPAIHFGTTDELSGIDHYEVRIIPLDPAAEGRPQSFFVEETSPYVPELGFGRYDVVVRAYDRAGNFAQKSARLVITTQMFDIVRGEGIKIASNVIVPWWWVFLLALLVIALLGLAVRTFWKRHHEADMRRGARELPPDVKKQLEELRDLKERYKPGVMSLLVLLGLAAFWSGSLSARAADVRLAPPIVTLVSADISNEDIFYVGGKAEAVGGEVLVYVQNLHDGGTLQETVAVEKDGGWFYAHQTFLTSGSYLIWTQLRAGSVLSPPSPQLALTVQPTALQIGASRLSYETIYFGISLALALAMVLLLGMLWHYRRAAERKRARILRELREVQDAVRRGFAALHRDLEAEFRLVQQAKLRRPLSEKERALEEHLRRDLEAIKRRLGKEVWDVEKEL